MLSSVSPRFRLDAREPADPASELERLRAFSPVRLPDDLVELLEEGSELEFAVDGGDHLRIWGAGGCIEMNEAYAVPEHIPSSLAVGDDERGSALIYVPGAVRPGYYLVGFGALDLDEAEFVAASLSQLLVDEVGIDVVA